MSRILCVFFLRGGFLLWAVYLFVTLRSPDPSMGKKQKRNGYAKIKYKKLRNPPPLF